MRYGISSLVLVSALYLAASASVLADTIIVDSKATGGFGFHPDEPPPAGGTPMVSGFVFEAPSTVVITATGRIDLYPKS